MNFHIIRCTQTKRFALNFQSDDRRGEKNEVLHDNDFKNFHNFFWGFFFWEKGKTKKKKKIVKVTSGKL